MVARNQTNRTKGRMSGGTNAARAPHYSEAPLPRLTASRARSWPPWPLVDELRAAQGGTGPVEVTDAQLDRIRNACRCGTYYRIRQAIRDYAGRL